MNSFHHQVVNRLPKECRAVARSDDGLIEALEAVAADRIFVGVQWHPEELYDSDTLSQALFAGFVRAAGQKH